MLYLKKSFRGLRFGILRSSGLVSWGGNKGRLLAVVRHVRLRWYEMRRVEVTSGRNAGGREGISDSSQGARLH